MKIKKIIFLLLLLIATSSQSKMAYSPDAIQIKEMNGKLYQMTREQWYQENIIPDESNELKPQQWATIIKKGQAELASTLLHALGEFLPNDELERYLTLGLLRKQANIEQARYHIAQNAYEIWADKLGWESAYQIRINKKLRQNLSPVVNWTNLFSQTGTKFETAAAAVEYLHNLQVQIDIGHNKYLKYQAINKIYHHDDLDDLQLWMKDSEFPVALGSWLALQRMAPEKYAKEILEHAIWWQAEIEYSYGTGCIRMSATLTPVLAALDLFSDYLSTDQIHKALMDVPDIWDISGMFDFGVNNPQTYEALQRFDHQVKHIYNLERIQNSKKLQAMNSAQLATYFDQEENRYRMDEIIFNQNLLDYLSHELKHNDDFDGKRFLYLAFDSKNEYAKQFVKLYMDKHLTQIKQTDRENLKDNLIRYVDIWPRDWQALKQQVIAKLQ